MHEAINDPKNTELNKRVDRMTPLMTCEERLGHAIEIDRIKIYPNHNLVIEKTKRRNIGKNQNLDDDVQDWSYRSDQQENAGDQTFYFALADCDGALEIFEDEEKREHLLGLNTLWKNIDENEYSRFENREK